MRNVTLRMATASNPGPAPRLDLVAADWPRYTPPPIFVPPDCGKITFGRPALQGSSKATWGLIWRNTWSRRPLRGRR